MNTDLSQIPKTETHLHVEGAIRADTYVELRRRKEPSYSLKESPWRNEGYRFDSLGHFLETASPCVVYHAEDYRRIALELFQDLLAQNVICAELTVASHQVEIGRIAQAIHDAWCEVVPEGTLEVGILVGLFRNDDPELAVEMVRQAIDARQYGVVGIDLLGDETANAAGVFKTAYGLALDAGLGFRVHAGEGVGADSVWDAIRSLGVSRIAHGTRAIEDPQLVNYLAEEGVTLDMCPTSNYMLRVVDILDTHPIRRLFDAGVKVTVSTDDPLFFSCDLTNELAVLRSIFGFTSEELLQLARNAVDGSFLSQEKKDRLHRILKEKNNKSMQAQPNGAPDV